jgi:hypothetical protein
MPIRSGPLIVDPIANRESKLRVAVVSSESNGDEMNAQRSYHQLIAASGEIFAGCQHDCDIRYRGSSSSKCRHRGFSYEGDMYHCGRNRREREIMNRSVVWVGCVLVLALAASAQAQCQGGGGRGGSPGGSMGASASPMMGQSMGYGGGSQSSVNPWAYAQLQSQAIARQMAIQAYQKKMADQARRAESLAQRQYWAAQRRQQKAPPSASPGNSPPNLTGNQLAANFRAGNSGSKGASLDMVPGNR